MGTLQLPWLVVKKPWSSLAGAFLGILKSGGAFAARRGLTIESLPMSGCG